MEISTDKRSAKIDARNKWAYSLGGIGRDMTYTLVATFLITYVQFAIGLKPEQFAAIGIILIIGRIWDAINDPMMGAIIENTHTRWGKFKPWILIGAVLTGIVIVLMFNVRPGGWSFVIFFAIIYLFWEIAYTMNDISYWSMLPALSVNPKQRNSIATLAVVFAGAGTFAANAAVTFFTVGNTLQGYSMIAVVIAIILIGCQVLTVFGVRQPEIKVEKQEPVTMKKMVNVIRKNDQLLWIILAMLLYNIGSNLFVSLGYNFIYLELGYSNTTTIVFIASFGVSSIGVQAFYSLLANKFTRKKLLLYSLMSLVFGYTILLLTGFIPFLPMNLIAIVSFGFFVFGGQAIFYMVLTVDIANTVEYNEYKTNERNESVIFSLRPFMAKLASALEQGLVTLVLISSGVYVLSQNITELENQKYLFDKMSETEQDTYRENANTFAVIFEGEGYQDLDADKKHSYYIYLQEALKQTPDTEKPDALEIKSAADISFKDQKDIRMQIMLRVAITAVPILLIAFSYVVLKKKFIIDEKMYEMMVKDIRARNIT